MKKMFRYFMGEQSDKKVVIGIAAMDKKAKSKQMTQIVTRLLAYGEFEVVLFGDDAILNKPVEEWPLCDYLLSWFSDGFPLEKAQAYIALRRVPTMNDLDKQTLLQDRRHMYQTLVQHGIPTAAHIIIDRDGLEPGQDPEGFVEDEDFVEMHGQRIFKPFVEKPFDGDDHNVHIYYPSSMGGGVKRLFRKIDNKSSQYDQDHPGKVRRDGSYLIEEFLPTGGTDVKVYTVGLRYAHAEARKSPVVDGKVQRTSDGKEMRFPVLLSPMEKDIACLVVNAFKQKICGFDLLRSEKGRVVVCDVNGWSFVKNSVKYYDDAAGIVRCIVLSAVAPMRLASNPDGRLPDSFMRRSSLSKGGPQRLEGTDEDEEDVPDDAEVTYTDERSRNEELRCVLAVIRHGDRTPKQKLKFKVTAEPLLALFHKHKDGKGKQAKLKTPLQLQELLDVTKDQLQLMELNDAALTPEDKDQQSEIREKLRIVKTVLEQAAFNGINRKVQLKPVRWRTVAPPPAPEDGKLEGVPVVSAYAPDTESPSVRTSPFASPEVQPGLEESTNKPMHRQIHPAMSFNRMSIVTDFSSVADNKSEEVLEEVLLILKWGGVLTHAGRQQAEDLGRMFRMVMYPRSGSGGGLLRLHSTYRHDLKIYSSDEGRVQASAAAFAKGLLDLEGNSLTPILVSLVNKDASMLEAFGKGASEDIEAAKDLIYTAMTYDPDKLQEAGSGSGVTGTSPPESPTRARKASGTSSFPPTAPSSLASSAIDLNNLIQRSASPGLGLVNVSIGGHGDQATPSWKEDPSGAFAEASKLKFFPKAPRQLLLRLHELMKGLVGVLRTICLQAPRETQSTGGATPHFRYSSLSQEPGEWKLELERPCSGEQALLMFDRWNKIFKGFYNEKKGKFDISKIPDIYDSAKYDAIHNRHLFDKEGSCIKELYEVAKELAGAVIPSEYGTDAKSKLTIGSKICGELLGKLMIDMATMREESRALTEVKAAKTPTGVHLREFAALGTEAKNASLQETVAAASARLHQQLEQCQESEGPAAHQGEEGDLGGAVGDETELEQHCQPCEEEHEETIHRLAPDLAQHINSPTRHVRTRIYYTSESHIHSLVNVLRFAHQHPANCVPPRSDGTGGSQLPPVMHETGRNLLDNTAELDYLTHIVIRMYESKTEPFESPNRFRVEILFSPGANYNPFEVDLAEDHVLPPVPRVHLEDAEQEGGVTLARIEELLRPLAKTRKLNPQQTFTMANNASSKGGSLNGRGSSAFGGAGVTIPSSKYHTMPSSRLGATDLKS